jgi:uncharacterized iron-regulated membrane protein
MVIWWPGIRRWRDSLTLRRNVNFKRLNWDLHSAIGFWAFGLVFMWATTGAYLVFPKPFDKLLDFFSFAPVLTNVGIFHTIHVGNFGGWPVKLLWVVLGLAPPVLFVTGFMMWWFRVLNPWRKRGLVPRSYVPEVALSVSRQPFQSFR